MDFNRLLNKLTKSKALSSVASRSKKVDSAQTVSLLSTAVKEVHRLPGSVQSTTTCPKYYQC